MCARLRPPRPIELRSPTGPARYGSPDFVAQALELLDLSARLTDEQKVIAEYWADGPRSELPPGHWNLFAQRVSHRDRTGSSEHESRPRRQAVLRAHERDLRRGLLRLGQQGRVRLGAPDHRDPLAVSRARRSRRGAAPARAHSGSPGEEWFPYQPTSFPTPPFAEYSSGHSNFSAAGAEILRLFTGSDRFGGSVTVSRGSSRVEPGLVPARDVTLTWADILRRRRTGWHLAPLRRHPLHAGRPRRTRDRQGGGAALLARRPHVLRRDRPGPCVGRTTTHRQVREGR